MRARGGVQLLLPMAEPEPAAAAQPATREGADGASAGEVKKKSRYRKDKPWDHEGIDHWKLEVGGRVACTPLSPHTRPTRSAQPFKEGDMKASLLEESAFATMFPQYREQYIREVWPAVTKHLKVRPGRPGRHGHHGRRVCRVHCKRHAQRVHRVRHVPPQSRTGAAPHAVRR